MENTRRREEIKEQREQKRTVYILLTDTGTLFTKSVKQYTGAPYNHASISFDEQLNEMYSFGRKRPHNPLYGGFVRENVYHGTYRYFPNTTCALYKIEVTYRRVERIRRVIRTFKTNQKHYTYNLIGLFGIMFNYPIEIAASYFCSQFVAEVLKRAGMPLWDKPSALVTPEDFRNAKELELIYEGKLFEYPPIKQHIESMNEEEEDSEAVNISLRKELLNPFKAKVKMAYYRSKKLSIHENFIQPQRKRLNRIISAFISKVKFEDLIGRNSEEKNKK